MIFLVEYERKSGEPAKVTEFPNELRHDAQQARLTIELTALGRNKEVEIVLLDAPSKATIRKTHRRYFESIGQILNSPVLEAA